MKRIAAWILVLVALMTWTAAGAESTGTKTRIKNMELSLVQNEDDYVRLHNMKLYVIVGSAEGVPTLQITLDYGDEQRLDSVLQVVGSRLLICIGGISGTYYVDLNELFDEPGKGLLLATAFGSTLQWFGSDPRESIRTLMPFDEEGVHTASIELPVEKLGMFLNRFLAGEEDPDAVQEEEVQSLTDTFLRPGEPIELKIRYWRGKRKIWFYLMRGDKGIVLYGRTKQSSGHMKFVNISEDEVQYNLLDLDQTTKDELIGELEFLGIKMGSFIRNSNLSRLSD